FLYYSKDQGLPDSRIYDFQEDLQNRIWITTQTGVSCFDGKRFKNYMHPLKESTMDVDWVGVHSLTIDKNGKIWESTTEQLFYFDEKLDTFIEYDLSRVELGQNLDSWANKIYLQDWKGDRNIWFRKGTGIYTINCDDLVCQRKLTIPLKYRSVWGVLGKDIEGNILVGGAGTNAITFFRPDGSFFTTANPFPLPSRVNLDPNGFDFTVDNGLILETNIFQQEFRNQIWVGGEQLLSYDINTARWEKWSNGSTGISNFSGITSIPTLTGDSVLWMFGQGNSVVTCFNIYQKRFTASFNTEHLDENGLRCGLMKAMFIDSRQNIWLGGNKGISVLFSNPLQFENYASVSPPGTIRGQISTNTRPEPYTGGTWKMPDGSLAEWVADGSKVYYVALSDHSKAYFEGERINHEISGICKFVDLQTGEKIVNQLKYQENKEGWWFESKAKTTFDNTVQPFLLFWPKVNNKIMIPRGEKFVPEKDLSGTWITTTNDLIYYFQDEDFFVFVHPEHIFHGKILNQKRVEGLEVRWWGGCRTEMAFAATISSQDSLVSSIRGLDTNCDLKKGFTAGSASTRFRPKGGKDSIFIHTFRVFDKIQPVNPKEYQQKSFELNYAQNFISFEFDCANSAYPILWYKMEGFDRDWFQTRSNKQANYTNLDGGDYTFMVKARDDSGLEMGRMATFRLHIISPYYRTWWFYSLCFVSGGLIFYSIFRYREIQRLRQEQLRLNIARDLHDEVGSTLSSISILSESAKLGGQNDLYQARLFNIGDKARDALDSISDIVWSINPKNDSMEMVLARMSTYASEMLENVGTTLHFQIGEDIESLTLPMAKRKDFYLLFKEAIHNCTKHAHAKHVEVKLEKQGTSLILRVKDDGIGFDMENGIPGMTNLGGNGLQNMNSRAKAMGGNLNVHSALGIGTEVQLELPV
ncbi:MAG: ATP-binding protein, partial [Saprospiraceae bacterium]